MNGRILILKVEEICDVKIFCGQVLVEAGNIKKMEAGEAGADEYVFLFDAPKNYIGQYSSVRHLIFRVIISKSSHDNFLQCN